MINRTVAALALAALLPATSALAANQEVNLTDEVADTIRTTLTEQGYEVGKIKTEDGLYEAYAKRDGKRLEIFMNADLEVVRTEVDD